LNNFEDRTPIAGGNNRQVRQDGQDRQEILEWEF